MKRTGHYRGGKFENSVPTSVMAPGAFFATMADWVGGEQVREPRRPPEVVRPDPALLAEPPDSGLRVTWLGHNTALIQMGRITVLTDPALSGRVTPVPGVGPRRFFPSPVAVDDLPHIDVVLVSHDHYDHLDMPTVQAIAPRTGTFVVPLGVGAHLRAWGVSEEKIVELRWWQAARPVKGLAVVATPARHFSGRGVLDRNKTLWATYALVGLRHRVFFGGDTGYFEGFAEIGRRLGPFDVTLLPIGAYGRNWPLIHLNPEEAVQAHLDLRGRVLLPVHWGTFNLATHAWVEPGERVMEAAAAAGVSLVLPRPGEAVGPEGNRPPERWWPQETWARATDADRALIRRVKSGQDTGPEALLGDADDHADGEAQAGGGAK